MIIAVWPGWRSTWTMWQPSPLKWQPMQRLPRHMEMNAVRGAARLRHTHMRDVLLQLYLL